MSDSSPRERICGSSCWKRPGSALQGTAISAAIIAVLVLVSYLVLAPSRVWLRDRQSVSDLQTRLDELVARQRPHLDIFVDNPSDPPFRFADPFTPDQEVITVGVRPLSPTPVHNVEIRIDKYAPAGVSTPPVMINTVEPLEIVRGALMFGHARPGQPVYCMILTVRRLPDVALPDVRVCYMYGALNTRYEPFPRGEWYLKVVATSEESPAARAYFHLTVKDDPKDRVLLTKLSPEEIGRIVAGGGAEATVFAEDREDGSANRTPLAGANGR